MIDQLISHLWQSTWFAAAAALLTLAFRGNRAKVRYGLWLCASIKFFVPFSLFIGLGGQLVPRSTTAPVVPLAVERIALTLAEPASFAGSADEAPRVSDGKPFALGGLWFGGFAAIVLMRVRGWRRVQSALRASTPVDTSAAVETRSAPGLLEPGVVGLLRPVLLLPEGIVNRLTPSQLEAVLAHELCHVRRHDNLCAALHMLVEATFWFHPMVWWIGARMVEERERACDEGVLSLGSEPRTYAEAILGVCKLYVESPLACVSGVTGADLTKRIEAIMSNRIGLGLNVTKKLLLAGAGAVALAGPVVMGVVIAAGHIPALRAQSPVMLPVAAQSARPVPAPVTTTNAAPQQRTVPVTPTPQYGRMLSLLFDCGFMTPDEQSRARQAAIQFVQTRMEPSEVMSVMVATSGKLAVIQDFTSDKAVLVSTISGVGTSVESNVGSQLATLELAARMLGAIQGKKALLYFSSGTPQIGPVDQAKMQQAIRTAQVSNVAFYMIDVRDIASNGQRVEEARARFGTTERAMSSTYTRYGQPDQIEDGGVSGQIWRYNYLDNFHSRVEFEFLPGKGPTGKRIIWPPPVTYQGTPRAMSEAADDVQRAMGLSTSANQYAAFPARHAEFQIYPAGELQVLSTPLDGLTGRIDIIGEVRRVLSSGTTQGVANARDAVTLSDTASNGTYSTAFTLDAGSYLGNVLVREQATGKVFSETIRFEVK